MLTSFGTRGNTTCSLLEQIISSLFLLIVFFNSSKNKGSIFLICKIKRNWSSKDQKIKLIKDVQNLVGKNKVICALSGGVDSSVVAQLLNKAIGKKLFCIFVNTGLLRKNEEIQVVKTFKKRLKEYDINAEVINREDTIKIVDDINDNKKNIDKSDILSKLNLKSNKFLNLYEARNEAIKKSRGEYVTFLDTDDYWSKDKLEKQID